LLQFLRWLFRWALAALLKPLRLFSLPIQLGLSGAVEATRLVDSRFCVRQLPTAQVRQAKQKCSYYALRSLPFPGQTIARSRKQLPLLLLLHFMARSLGSRLTAGANYFRGNQAEVNDFHGHGMQRHIVYGAICTTDRSQIRSQSSHCLARLHPIIKGHILQDSRESSRFCIVAKL
jgi:hypothetical protein